jgi:hypothetical protein
MRLRTYLLLALAVASGTGIAVFSMYADGMYSAICLLFFPFLSLLMFASIAFDIARPREVLARAVAAKLTNATTTIPTPTTTMVTQAALRVATVNRAAAATG